MKFDETLAKQLIDEHGLSPNTLRIWKLRGAIPKKYAKTDYRKPVAAKEDATAQRIREIVSLPEIAHSNFRAFDKHPNYATAAQRAQDVKRGHPLDEREKAHFLAECAELRNLLSAAATLPTTTKLRKVLKDKRIHAVVLLDRDLYRKAVQEDGSAMLAADEKQEVQRRIKVLKIKLQV